MRTAKAAMMAGGKQGLRRMVGEVVVDVVVAQEPIRGGCHRQNEGQRDAENAQEKPETEAQYSRKTRDDEGNPRRIAGITRSSRVASVCIITATSSTAAAMPRLMAASDSECAHRRQQEPGDILIGHGAAAGEADDSAKKQSDEWHEQRRSDQSDCEMRRSEGLAIGERSAEMRRDLPQCLHRSPTVPCRSARRVHPCAADNIWHRSDACRRGAWEVLARWTGAVASPSRVPSIALEEFDTQARRPRARYRPAHRSRGRPLHRTHYPSRACTLKCVDRCGAEYLIV